ncbi:MAG: radical SAM protein [Firmicutes bacterium]|nr:radical SAM protein [Bacillota bacterium]
MNDKRKKWKQSEIREKIASYREASLKYYIEGKALVEMSPGQIAFSLLSPPLGSAVAKRRVRWISKNIVSPESAKGAGAHSGIQNRTPHFLTMAVTYDCQCNCLHCSAHDYKMKVASSGTAMNFEELRGALEQAVVLGTTGIVLTGGEPLIYPEIYKLIESVDKKKSICTIFTNGEYLNAGTVSSLKKAGTHGVFVSLDDSDPESHNKHRGRAGLFEKALEGIKLCQEAGILTGISTYVTREKINNGELHKMMELAKRLKVLEVFIFDVIPAGKIKKDEGCILTKNEISMITELRNSYNEKADYPRILHQTMFASLAYPCVAEGCPAAVVQLHIRGNGDVSPCDFTPYSFGNLRTEPLKDIWQKMISHPLYSTHSPSCRLGNPGFREKLIEHGLIS